jgi:hypothetical protein
MLPPTRRGEGRSGTQRILDARLRGLNVQSQGRCLCGPRCVDQAQDSLDIGSLLRVPRTFAPSDNTRTGQSAPGHPVGDWIRGR